MQPLNESSFIVLEIAVHDNYLSTASMLSLSVPSPLSSPLTRHPRGREYLSRFDRFLEQIPAFVGKAGSGVLSPGLARHPRGREDLALPILGWWY